jgi:hypothetical protein
MVQIDWGVTASGRRVDVDDLYIFADGTRL